MAEVSKSMHLHLSFFVSQNPDAARYAERSFISFEIKDETEFKAWLGQVMCNMYDLYKTALTQTGEQEVSPETMRLLSNPLYLELRSWVDTQLTYLAKSERPWTTLEIRLGEDYGEFIKFLDNNGVELAPKVRLILDGTIGRYDRKCEVIYAG